MKSLRDFDDMAGKTIELVDQYNFDGVAIKFTNGEYAIVRGWAGDPELSIRSLSDREQYFLGYITKEKYEWIAENERANSEALKEDREKALLLRLQKKYQS